MTYALDTNIVSFILRNDEKVVQRWRQEEAAGNRSIITPFAYYEIKRGLIAAGAATKLTAFERLCDMLGIDTMDIETLDKASEIYASLKKSGNLIEDSDILIAASGLAHDYVVVTDNTRHFNRVDGLKYVNWVE